MNKLFIKPEIDIYKFTVNDIVYTSGSELTRILIAVPVTVETGVGNKRDFEC